MVGSDFGHTRLPPLETSAFELQASAMKSCFGLLLAMLILLAVLATGGGLWYLSQSAEFARQPAAATNPNR